MNQTKNLTVLSDNLRGQPREWWQAKCRDLYFFETVVLSTAWDDKFHDFGIIHKYLCYFLDLLRNPSRRKFISIFRGSYKTTTILGLCVFLFIWSIVTNIPTSICYNTSTRENAEIFMEDFRTTLLECKFLQWIFPWLPRAEADYKKWTKWKVEFKNTKFHVASLETRQVMRHYTVYINDDLVNDDNAFSEKERATVFRKWRLQKSILTKQRKKKIGLEIDVGTPFHSQDLVSHIMKKIKSYDKFVVPYKIRLEDGSEILTLPEVYEWEDFDEIREDQEESMFATQYELRIIDDSDRVCYERWIKEWTWLPENYNRYLIIDPGGWEENKSDPSSFLIFDVDENGTIYTLFANEFWISPKQLPKFLEQLKSIYNPDEILFEKEKYSVTIADTLEYLAPLLNFSFVEHKGRPKEKRIHKQKQWWEMGRVLINKESYQLKEQAINYPDVPHEGLLECLSYGIETMEVPKKGLIREVVEPREKDFEEEIRRAGEKPKKESHDAYF